jgi:hypothetical protein
MFWALLELRALYEAKLKAKPTMVKHVMKCIITCESLANFVLFSKGGNPLARALRKLGGFF